MSIFTNGKALDRNLIAEVVEHEMLRQYGTWAQMERSALHRGGTNRPVSQATLRRVRNGSDNVTRYAFARVEAMLWLPPGTLEAVGNHDTEALTALEVDKSLIVWITHRIKRIQAEREAAQA